MNVQVAKAPRRPTGCLFAFGGEQIEACREWLNEDHLAILRASVSGKSSYEEMAQNLGLKVGTVKSRLNRARHALRPLLKHPNGTPMYAVDWTPLDELGHRHVIGSTGA